jgi:hypothetical protein
MILPVNIHLPFGTLSILYSTSEILTCRDWSLPKPFIGKKPLKKSLLVLYGKLGSTGEIALDHAINQTVPKEVKSVFGSNTLTLIYQYSAKPLEFKIKSKYGDETTIIILDTYTAGTCWFPIYKHSPAMICGLEFVDESKPLWSLPAEVSGKSEIFVFLAKESPTRVRVGSLLLAKSVTSGSFEYSPLALPFRTLTFTDGFLTMDNAEATSSVISSSASYSDMFKSKSKFGWIKLGDNPKDLDSLGFATGHSWYRATVTLTSTPANPYLYIPSASNFVAIYINGHYITTLNPIGTEIDSKSSHPNYGFQIPNEVLKIGVNHLAFHIEIWGHGNISLSLLL